MEKLEQILQDFHLFHQHVIETRTELMPGCLEPYWFGLRKAVDAKNIDACEKEWKRVKSLHDELTKPLPELEPVKILEAVRDAYPLPRVWPKCPLADEVYACCDVQCGVKAVKSKHFTVTLIGVEESQVCVDKEQIWNYTQEDIVDLMILSVKKSSP